MKTNKKTMILGIIRHALTFAGGVLLMRGYATEQEVQEITGAAVTLIGAVWSVVEKARNK
jgi:hypothetical protein